MPEVMEIRKYSDFINEYFVNKILTEVNILKGRYKTHKPFENYDLLKKSLPIKLLSVKSKGKFIYFEFENGIYLLNTLGLSGGWAYQKNSNAKYQMPQLLKYVDNKQIDDYLTKSLNHINVEFVFKKEKLVFVDMLSFGTLKIENNYELLIKKLNTIGKDIMDVDYDSFLIAIRKKNNEEKEIGKILLNQKIISGIGNYIRADALWLSKINPFKLTKKLTENNIKELFHALKIITWGL